MHKLKHIKEVLENEVIEQLSCIDEVNTKELGEVIDMIKDIEKSMYYCSIVKAMEEEEGHSEYKHSEEHGHESTARRAYMESKDKISKIKSLEKYMSELSDDLVGMIADASPEEKQLLDKKITALASKISALNV